MRIIRPLTYPDLPALERLAIVSGGSMTTLPANRDHLNELIMRTQNSMRKAVEQHHDESYHFVMEDTEHGEIVGVCGIDTSVGLNSPFYSYRMEEVVHASSELQIHNRVPALHLCQDYTGSARLCTLFLDGEHRNETNLQLLSRSRLLFIAQHRQRFANRLIAELQGVADEQNRSPFWESLGSHFFSMDFTKANYLTGINSKGFIADLMPHYPVYVPLLSQEAQQALGQPRPDMAPVKALLEREGFVYRNYVDIFDAGPTLEGRVDALHSITTSQLCTPAITVQRDATALQQVLVANTETAAFRCILTELDPVQPTLLQAEADALQLAPGAAVRLVAL